MEFSSDANHLQPTSGGPVVVRGEEGDEPPANKAQNYFHLTLWLMPTCLVKVCELVLRKFHFPGDWMAALTLISLFTIAVGLVSAQFYPLGGNLPRQERRTRRVLLAGVFCLFQLLIIPLLSVAVFPFLKM